jgi:hypothetical protein
MKSRTLAICCYKDFRAAQCWAMRSVDGERDSRTASAIGFAEATDPMTSHFDTALTAFQTDAHNGKGQCPGDRRIGGGSLGTADIAALLLVVRARRARKKFLASANVIVRSCD